MPERWSDLSDKQLRYVITLIADEYNIDELKTLCLFQWSNIKVIGRQETGAYFLQKGKFLFELTPLALAELLPHLDWLVSIPTYPVRLSKIYRCYALPTDFSEVPFEKFIMAHNLYQGYLATDYHQERNESNMNKNIVHSPKDDTWTAFAILW